MESTKPEENYGLLKQIGEGGQGKTFLVRCESTQQPAVIKQLALDND